ncbi:hypothetical protein BZA70DRAFT_48396 [Myxozyma melibiosi]|uniref:HMG box domain-containing protein n=1 Tax=Myxozyma melibiosi TaxID=54550 RepID=A0ABR1FEW6_9ASCO
MLLKYAVCTTRVPAYAVTRQLSTIASRSALHVPKAAAYGLFQRLAVPAAKFYTTAGAAAEVKSEEAKPKAARKTAEKKAPKKAPKKKKAVKAAPKRIKKPVDMPHGPMSPYNVFFLKYRAEHPEETNNIKAPECARLVSQAFKQLSTAELEELKKEAKERSIETKKKLAEFALKLGPAGVALENKRRQQRAKKLNLAHTVYLQDPFKPKYGALSGPTVFLAETVKLPEYANLPISERFKTVAAIYKSLSEDQKLPYVNRALANREKYHAEKQAYEKLLKEDQTSSAAR